MVSWLRNPTSYEGEGMDHISKAAFKRVKFSIKTKSDASHFLLTFSAFSCLLLILVSAL
jgi:hypothetical protein